MLTTTQAQRIAEIAKTELIEDDRCYSLTDEGIRQIAEALSIDTEAFLGTHAADIEMAIPTDDITKSIRFPRIKKMKEIIGA